jgi:hypothetical protein
MPRPKVNKCIIDTWREDAIVGVVCRGCLSDVVALRSVRFQHFAGGTFVQM